MREAISNLGRLAIMGNVGNPIIVLELGELQAAARELGLQLDTLEIRGPEDIASALDVVKGRSSKAKTSPLSTAERAAITGRLPALADERAGSLEISHDLRWLQSNSQLFQSDYRACAQERFRFFLQDSKMPDPKDDPKSPEWRPYIFTGDEWHCRICGERFQYSETVRKHIADAHDESMPPGMYQYFRGAVWQRRKIP